MHGRACVLDVLPSRAYTGRETKRFSVSFALLEWRSRMTADAAQGDAMADGAETSEICIMLHVVHKNERFVHVNRNFTDCTAMIEFHETHVPAKIGYLDDKSLCIDDLQIHIRKEIHMN
eukprot:5145672-Pleurochrysis_carterae.AAC.1